MPTPADLFVSPDLTEAQARAYLESLGFRDPVAADDHLQQMADDLVVREALGRLAPDLIPSLLESPDPDAALAGLSHYVAARTGRAMFLDYLREDPRALHVLTYVLGASPPLSDILIRTPEYFHWLVSQVERSAPDRRDHEEELASAFSAVDDHVEALNILRRWKRREILRIGTRELLRRETVQTVAMQLSDVACVVLDVALAIVVRDQLETDGRDRTPGTFAIVATGALAAQEISYTCPLGLHFVYDTTAASDEDPAITADFFATVCTRLIDALAEDTREGQLYQVARAAWPEAGGRATASSLADYIAHFQESAGSQERELLTRMRAVAGDGELGDRFVSTIQPLVYEREPRPEPPNPASMKEATGVVHVPGGTYVADIDRLTVGFQLSHGGAHPALRDAGTLVALEAMCQAGLIEESVRRELNHAYVFLRSAEHRRQLGVPEDVERQLAASRDRVREIVHGR